MKRIILSNSLFLTLVIFCGIVFCILGSLDSLSEKREIRTNQFNQLYSIKPESLLEDLYQGKTDAFSQIDKEPPFPPPDQQIAVPWMQDDYFHIANVLSESIWNDTLADWQLKTMYFNLACTQSDVGFQSGIFTFIRKKETNGHRSRIERIIKIDPGNKFVYVTEDEYTPSSWDWKVIDMARIKVSANEALQIAESNGGKEKRQAVANACYISLILSPSPLNDNGWIVSYTLYDEYVSFFSVLTDPYTGEIYIPK